MYSARLMMDMVEIRRKMPCIDLLNPDVLIRNLLHVYHVIRASENLIAVALMLSGSLRLKEFLQAKLEEEKSHAEWLCNDLTTAGIDTTQIPHSAAALAGAQYYMIYHVSPVCLLGYMAALECFPTPLDHLELLERYHGKNILRTVRYHAEHDVGHGTELLDFCNQLPEDEQALVTQAAVQATELLRNSILQLISTESENSHATESVVYSESIPWAVGENNGN